jgi:hypothetical protein
LDPVAGVDRCEQMAQDCEADVNHRPP